MLLIHIVSGHTLYIHIYIYIIWYPNLLAKLVNIIPNMVECHKTHKFFLIPEENTTFQPLSAADEVTFLGRPLVLPDWSEAATVYGQAYYHGCLMCHLVFNDGEVSQDFKKNNCNVGPLR